VLECTTQCGDLLPHNHIGFIISVARHLFGRIHHFEEHRRVMLKDLRLWLDFLEPPRNQPEHSDDQRVNNSLLSLGLLVQLVTSSCSPFTEPHNSKRPKVLRLYCRAMNRFTGREYPRVLLHLVSDRQHNSRRLNEQEQRPRRKLSAFHRFEKSGKNTTPGEIPTRQRNRSPETQTK
jgi:hypothetical protein